MPKRRKSTPSATNVVDVEEQQGLNFHEMGLDDRILKAIGTLGWGDPTPIQEQVIPLAMEGKDILAQARTGSGKTAAFAIPIIQHILDRKELSKLQTTKALIMAPTKELCKQIAKNFMELCTSCSKTVRSVNISVQADVMVQRAILMERPDIVIGTPKSVADQIKAKNLTLNDGLEFLVIDEPDFCIASGYEQNIEYVLKNLPEIYQKILTSATLTKEISIKGLKLRNPVELQIDEPRLPSTNQLQQYHIKCEEEEKFVIIFSLFKLRLIKGKTIIFMNSVDRCYRMKLYLEQFGIKTCVLNAELPVSSRCHIVSQFNDGLYDTIVASDDRCAEVSAPTEKDKGNAKKKRKVDKEYGVSRGIDFQFVSNVINFDFPDDVDTYIHRVGRTARGKNQGSALSFVSSKELEKMEKVEKTLAEKGGVPGTTIFKQFLFQVDKIKGFQYRSVDASRSVTRIAIREARLKEIRKELLNSQKLKTFFEDNPRDLKVLRHDKSLHVIKAQPHLKNVPEYIIPESLKHVTKKRKFVKMVDKKKPSKGERKFERKKADPLKSFNFDGFKKSNRSKK